MRCWGKVKRKNIEFLCSGENGGIFKFQTKDQPSKFQPEYTFHGVIQINRKHY